MNRDTWVIYFCLALYSACFFILKPALPTLIKTIPDSDEYTYGYIQTVTSIAGLLGGNL